MGSTEVSEKVEVEVETEDTVVFSKPYVFEGKTYKSLDFSGLENIKAKDMIEAHRTHDRAGGFSVMPEMSMEYALYIASRATDKPIEFFMELPPRDALRVKNKVVGFFFGQD